MSNGEEMKKMFALKNWMRRRVPRRLRKRSKQQAQKVFVQKQEHNEAESDISGRTSPSPAPSEVPWAVSSAFYCSFPAPPPREERSRSLPFIYQSTDAPPTYFVPFGGKERRSSLDDLDKLRIREMARRDEMRRRDAVMDRSLSSIGF
ncbi:hypothetical protein BT69DRAFT_1283616 [Atractiella rhizophila]|nr:hypothetical protein BT69DRAFT_1283616 [Atractiella rhizophila]